MPGIGPFSAGLILLRGAGPPDLLPLREPRLRRAVAMACGLDEPPSSRELERLATRWRPYCTRWPCTCGPCSKKKPERQATRPDAPVAKG